MIVDEWSTDYGVNVIKIGDLIVNPHYFDKIFYISQCDERIYRYLV